MSYNRSKNKKNKGKYKSVFERRIAEYLKSHRLDVVYEADTFDYVRPSSYTPDWKLRKGVYIESKGYFSPADRRNLLAFKSQYPEVEILILFANAANRLHKKSKITYGQWAEKNGFRWGDFFKNGIPRGWFTSTNGSGSRKRATANGLEKVGS